MEQPPYSTLVPGEFALFLSFFVHHRSRRHTTPTAVDWLLKNEVEVSHYESLNIFRNGRPSDALLLTLSKLCDVSDGFVPHSLPLLRQCIALFAVAEGWMLLDIR